MTSQTDVGDLPKVSVLVASYQVEPYLRRCLDSVVGQSLREIEVIVVDDASSDGSAGIAREYAATDPRVRIVSHDRNRGLGAVRNTGIDAATGRYLAFVDGDDWLRRDALERLHARCEEEAVPVALFPAVDYVEAEERFEDNPYTSLRVPSRFRVGPDTLGRMCATTWSKLYDRALVVRSRVRFPDRLNHQDEQFHFCFFASTEPEVATVDERLYVYRQRAGSVSGRQREVRRDVPAVFGNIWSFLEAEGLTSRYGDLFCRMLAIQIGSVMPDLERDAQAPFYEGMREVVSAIVASEDAPPTLPEPLPELREHGYVAFLQERQRELLALRRDDWYRLGRLDGRERMRRLLRLGLDGVGLRRVADGLGGWARRLTRSDGEGQRRG